MRKGFLAIICLITLQIHSQKNDQLPYSFGQVYADEINMKIYDKDRTAHAVVLYKYGNTEVVYESGKSLIRTVVYGRIKILDKNGENHATIKVPIYFKNEKYCEKVKKVRAITHNREEPKSILKNQEIYTSTTSDKWKEVSFTFPNVKPGSVLEYEYTFESEFFYRYKGWKFQSDIPTVYSELHALIPGNWTYNKRLIGSKKLDKEELDIQRNCFDMDIGRPADCQEMNYAMKDIPAFVEEEYMTNKNNFISRIEFLLARVYFTDGSFDNLTTTWKETDRILKYSESIGKQISSETFFEKNIPQDILNISDDLDRAKAIYNFIKNHFVWNKEFKIFDDIDVKDAFREGRGNISEINMALINALKAGNIDAKIMLSATRKAGFPTKAHPLLYDYNYMLAYVKIEDEVYLLDASDKLMPFGLIAFRSLNGYGRVMDFSNGSFWYDIKPLNKNSSRTTLIIDVAENSITGKLKRSVNGYSALSKRTDLQNKTDDEYMLEMENNSRNIAINSYKNLNKEDPTKPFIEEMDIEFEESDRVGDIIYFNPFLNKINTNPFQLNERTYPVDFGYTKSKTYLVKINVPENYTVKSLPQNVVLKLPNQGGAFICNWSINKMEINIFYKLKIDKTSYDPKEYPYLKELYNQIIKTQNSLITLEKI